MIHIVGDTHGEIDLDSTIKQLEVGMIAKDDTIIVLGDFGVLWKDIPDDEERDLIEFWNSACNTVLWIDGNHENFNRIEKLPVVEMFGSTVGVVAEGIYHLQRGKVYTIEGRTFFTFGGGYSIDKHLRMPFVSWWHQELPTIVEMKTAFDSLKEVDYSVDYILTHSAPLSVFQELRLPFGAKYNSPEEIEFLRFLEEIKEKTKFNKWFFGHYHIDTIVENCYCLYRDICCIAQPGHFMRRVGGS